MKEPATTALSAAFGITLVSGTVLGLPAEALLGGFGGGITMLALSEKEFLWRRKVSLLAGSTISAGYVAPLGAAVSAPYLPASASLQDVLLRAMSFAVGFGAQYLLPAAIEAAVGLLKKRGGA